jgi:hypothetical protein
MFVIRKHRIEKMAGDVLLMCGFYYYGIIEDAWGRDTRSLTSLIVAKTKIGHGG